MNMTLGDIKYSERYPVSYYLDSAYWPKWAYRYLPATGGHNKD